MCLVEDSGIGADVGFNASVTIEELGSPDKIIQGFAPELYGSPLSVCLSSCPEASDFHSVLRNLASNKVDTSGMSHEEKRVMRRCPKRSV